MAAKGREKIKLASTGKTKAGKITGTFKTTSINKSKAGDKKLERRMYDRLAFNAQTGKMGMHVLFRQEKLK